MGCGDRGLCPVAARHAGRLILLKDGQILAAGPPAEALHPASIRAAYGVEAEVLCSAAGHLVVAPVRPV